MIELVELMSPREVTENERKGRSSGSLDWKLSRGEQNVNNVSERWMRMRLLFEFENLISFQFYVFNANASEVQQKQFNLRYSCSENVYERFVIVGGTDRQSL